MKSLVLSLVITVTFVINAVSGNKLNEFAYNSEKQENGVETKMVYKVKQGKYLERHLQHNYAHDAQGRVSAKEILKWNKDNQSFEKLYCLNFIYTDNEVNVEYALWDNSTNDFTRIKSKAIYQINNEGINYLAYQWNETENNWDLKVEHNTVYDNERLLAERSERL